MHKITPCLWFDGTAEEAVNFYTGLFEKSRIIDTKLWGPHGGEKEGTPLLITFEIADQQYQALNGGPEFTFNEAISLSVECSSQDEVDRLWDILTSNGGEESQCGWLKDKYGLSWQIVPPGLNDYLFNANEPQRSAQATEAMMQMRKLDINVIKRAFDV